MKVAGPSAGLGEIANRSYHPLSLATGSRGSQRAALALARRNFFLSIETRDVHAIGSRANTLPRHWSLTTSPPTPVGRVINIDRACPRLSVCAGSDIIADPELIAVTWRSNVIPGGPSSLTLTGNRRSNMFLSGSNAMTAPR